MTRQPSISRIVAKRRLASARTRRWRARLALNNGCGIAPAPYDNDIIELLLDLGWLAEPDSEDRQQIGAAIYWMVKDAARAHKAA